MFDTKRIFVLLMLSALLLTACIPLSMRQLSDAPLSEGQTLAQLHLEGRSETLCAAWIPYFTCDALFASDDEEVCRNAVRVYLKKLREFGINTVFVHVCAFGESTYPSAYYPNAPGAHGHDELRIFTEICAEEQIALHAWINPLRLQTEEYMNAQQSDALICGWYRDLNTKRLNLSRWDGRWYLNPASSAAGDFLAGVIGEIIAQYHPAGIHIDDYFYPTVETAWDMNDFAASGATDLAEWRRENITALVRRMYAAVHTADAETVFSISPQGNLSLNRDELYADIEKWCKEPGCCDLIVPQLYFGYENDTCPYADTLAEWASLPRAASVAMAAGLAAYKVGETDGFAGSGLREWQTSGMILARQAADAQAVPDFCGLSFYHADALLHLPELERDALRSVLMAEQENAASGNGG